jgi:polyhydroxyalkanoate synthesis repressor PhaR
LRKYPNRRLYDRENRAYIRLDHIRALVQECQAFVVRAGDRDVTREVLLQTLIELEAQGAPVFSRKFLSDVIRLQANGSGEALLAYLAESLRLLIADAGTPPAPSTQQGDSGNGVSP